MYIQLYSPSFGKDSYRAIMDSPDWDRHEVARMLD